MMVNVTPVQAWAAPQPGARLALHHFTLAPPGDDEVVVDVQFCGICHSDLAALQRGFAGARFPLIAGHEVVGTVVLRGKNVSHLGIGQRVGVGWLRRACRDCGPCTTGDANLCDAAQPMLADGGGFASHICVQAQWAVPLPAAIDSSVAGPLLCAGITVFNPLLQYGVRPTDRVAVVGAGGLGHLALQFANKWGCEVTALTSNLDKRADLLRLGAHHVLSSCDSRAWRPLAGRFDFILVTVNVPLDWQALIETLRPRGRLHCVGIVRDPIALSHFSLLSHQRQVSASPCGAPAALRTMFDFCARHHIEAVCEVYDMHDVNAALAHLQRGKARYRVVLRGNTPQ